MKEPGKLEFVVLAIMVLALAIASFALGFTLGRSAERAALSQTTFVVP